MTIKVGVNGLGRIGKCVLRGIVETGRNDIEVVAVNAPGDINMHAHLMKYDSVHGPFNAKVAATDTSFDFGLGPVKRFDARDPSQLDWKAAGADIVLECTGKFTKLKDASQHLMAGAKKVLISAPSPDAHATIVYGVNNEVLKKDDSVISVGSCTTNCLAPVAKVLDELVGIESGYMTTIHAYTNDQNILDGSHKDYRRARAGAVSMIPTSTGAAKALGLVLPQLSGKLDGTAIRVPTPNVSLVDLTFIAGRDTSVAEINGAMQAAASSGSLKGVLGICTEPLVSVDFVHSPFSSVFDATQTAVLKGRMCRVAAWYDNEWGFSLRMLDVAALAA